MNRTTRLVFLAFALATQFALHADDVTGPLAPITDRYADPNVTEEPSFQKHVVPLFGRLGCNGRACHGSFQGAGGFQLSLFGYDFKFDHDSLLKTDEGRVNLASPHESLILNKPASDENHEGGQRFTAGGWEHSVLRRWIESGAKYNDKEIEKLASLEVTPAEIVFTKKSETVQLRVIAHWASGMREDVTPLCRYISNNEQVALANENGLAAGAESGDTHLVISYDKAVVSVPVIRSITDLVGDKYPSVATKTKIDELVVNKLRKLGVVPSDVCSDQEFLRRVSLDLAGTLPSASEFTAFLSDTSPNKRAEKVDELLATPAYAAWWTTKLCDITGNNDQQLQQFGPRGSASQQWYDWIHKRVTDNVPYDEIASGIVLGQSRKPGQSYVEFCSEMSQLYQKNTPHTYAEFPSLPHYWARNNFRQPEDRAIGFAYTFLGVRIQCAQCHKHPFDVWSKQDFENFKGFFTRVAFARGPDKENRDEYNQILKDLGLDPTKKGNQLDKDLQKMVTDGKVIPFGEIKAMPPKVAVAKKENKKDKDKGKNNKAPAAQTARLLGTDTQVNLDEFGDAREPLLTWLRAEGNPYFARAFVNRVWANYFNVGIVEPPDDMSLGNPPSNEPLLDYLSRGFAEHKFDMKWLHREIVLSDTYQRSWKTNATNERDDRNFSHAIPRRLPAEVAYDAMKRATANDATANQMLVVLKDRAIAIAGSSAQANGKGPSSFALKVFGRSIRESNCDCDRSSEASLLQTVYLQNDNEVLASLSPSRGTWMEQVSAQFNPPKPKVAEAAKNEKKGKNDPARTLKELERKLAEATKQENVERVARLEKLIAQAREQAAKQAAPVEKPAPVEPAPAEPVSVPEMVRMAYLRTLTREPESAELQRSLEFIAQAKSPAQGLRDVLWALLNTKEFIVNH